MTSLTHLDLEKIAFYPNGLVQHWRVLRNLIHPDIVPEGEWIVAELLEYPPKGKKAEVASIEALSRQILLLPMASGELHFLRHYDLDVQINELFLSDHYNLPRPVDGDGLNVVDAVSNIGISVLRVNKQYPDSKVIAMEPNPKAANAVRRNFESFGFTDVEVMESGVGTEDGHLDMHISKEMPMASSASDRMAQSGMPTTQLRVPCIGIRGLLNDRVDFLKLDIEGLEYQVLDAAKPCLNKVSQLFCEFHFGHDLPKSLMTASLAQLDEEGFDWILDKAQGSWQRPFTLSRSSGRWRASMNLWARQG